MATAGSGMIIPLSLVHFHNIPHYIVYPPNGMEHFLREETQCQLLSYLGSTAFSVVPKNLTCTQWILFSSLRKTFGFLHPTRAGLSLSPEDHLFVRFSSGRRSVETGEVQEDSPYFKKKNRRIMEFWSKMTY